MPSQTQIQNKLLSAKALQANMAYVAATTESAAGVYDNWCKLTQLSGLIFGLTTQYNIGDYISTTTVSIYNQLSGIVGFQYNPAPAYSPNSPQIPATIFVKTGGGTVNTGFIGFTNQTNVSLSNYPTTYAPTYGANPISVQIYVSDGSGGFIPDFGTAPDYQYIVSGNPSSGLSSVTWGYGVPATGFIKISGVQQS